MSWGPWQGPRTPPRCAATTTQRRVRSTRRWRAVGVALLAVAVPAAAHGKLLDLYAGPRMGVMQGSGQGLRGVALGAEVGAEVVFFDLMVDYHALVGGARSGASATDFLLGIDGDFALDDTDALFLRLGGASGLGLLTSKIRSTTGQELSYKGLVLRGTLAIERHLDRFVVVGLEFTGGYHYLLESGLLKQLMSGMAVPEGTTAQQDRWVTGSQFAALITLRAHFEPFR
jgi:hypothetical protein